MSAPLAALLPTLPVYALQEQPGPGQWLVHQLWGAAAVGVIGGSPKLGLCRVPVYAARCAAP